VRKNGKGKHRGTGYIQPGDILFPSEYELPA
jgi:hypothetical protein